MRREKETTLPNHKGTNISSDIQDMPVHHTGVELVFPRCCSEVDASLCGLCSLWKLLWHRSSAGIWYSNDAAGCRGYLLDGNIGLVTVCLPVLTKARGSWNSVLLKKVCSAKELAAWYAVSSS